MNLTVRKLIPGDEEAIRYLSTEAIRFEQEGITVPKECVLNTNKLRKFLNSENNHLLVAFDIDKPVGFLLAYELERYHGDAKMLLIYEIGVDQYYRRQGVGNALWAELVRLSKERGIRQGFVVTNESNKPAMAFYQSRGGKRPHPDVVEFDFEF